MAQLSDTIEVTNRRCRTRCAVGDRAAFWWLVVLLTLSPLRAQTHVMSGPADPNFLPKWEEAFAEGPFQKPNLAADAGDVSWPTASQHADARRAFELGLAALHRLDDREAERCFRWAMTVDRDGPMAYAGLALANDRWPGRAALFIGKAFEKKSSATPAERALIEALAGFYSNLKANASDRGRKLIAALEEITAQHPEDAEIGALLVRWLIVARDRCGVPLTSPLAVDALIRQVLTMRPQHPVKTYRLRLWAEAHGDRGLPALEGAPATPGSLRAGAGIIARLGRFDAAAEWFAAAVTAAERHPSDMEDWRLRNAALVARCDALASAGRASALRQLAGVDPAAMLDGLLRLEQWDVIRELPAPHRKASAEERGVWLHARTLSEFQAGHAESAWPGLAEFQQLAALAKKPPAAEPRAVQEKLDAWLVELEAHNLLSRKLPAEAAARLRAAPSLPVLRRSRFFHIAGDAGEACCLAADSLRDHRHALPETANFIEIQFASGHRREAFQEFTQPFRQLCAAADATLPCFERLAPVADAMQLPKNWKLNNPPPESPRPSVTVSRNPPAEPPLADWTLPDGAGQPKPLAIFRGRPAVFLFFLGAKCQHCMRQLNTFAPLDGRFRGAGGQIIAVSTDDIAQVAATRIGFDPDKAQPPPFVILADPALNAFRAWGAYDEFNQQPIHGTFILDAAGSLRWRHLGTDPFMMAGEVLREVEKL
jgi:peroxiredoxin